MPTLKNETVLIKPLANPIHFNSDLCVVDAYTTKDDITEDYLDKDKAECMSELFDTQGNRIGVFREGWELYLNLKGIGYHSLCATELSLCYCMVFWGHAKK